MLSKYFINSWSYSIKRISLYLSHKESLLYKGLSNKGYNSSFLIDIIFSAKIRFNPLNICITSFYFLIQYNSYNIIKFSLIINYTWSTILFKSKEKLGRAAIVDSKEYLSSSGISNQKVLNSLRVIDLTSFLLESLLISFLEYLLS